ncbi:hypothetical protein ABVN80_21695 [Acinetobacter baumannii]
MAGSEHAGVHAGKIDLFANHKIDFDAYTNKLQNGTG